MFESLYVAELRFLHGFQYYFEGWDTFWMNCTQLGDPAFTVSLYFPLFFALWPQRSVKFLLAGAISEFANAVLKWALHGDRPYWYVFEHHVDEVSLRQTALTCETGPGNPSGHVMVTCAVFAVIVAGVGLEVTHTTMRIRPKLYASERQTSLVKNLYAAVKSSLSAGLWLVTSTGVQVAKRVAFVIFVLLVAFSRLFIVAHFPHQVLFAVIAGLLIGRLACSLDVGRLTRDRHQLLLVAFSMVILASVVHLSLTHLLGWELEWSVYLARRYCDRSEWIHVSTTPMASLTRNVATVVGVWLSTLFSTKITNDMLTNTLRLTIPVTMVASGLSLINTNVLFSLLHAYAHSFGIITFYSYTALVTIITVTSTTVLIPSILNYLIDNSVVITKSKL